MSEQYFTDKITERTKFNRKRMKHNKYEEVDVSREKPRESTAFKKHVETVEVSFSKKIEKLRKNRKIKYCGK